MVPKPTSAKSQVQESDVAANEALLQYAEASKLAKSWLSGSLGNADPNKATEDEADLQKEQELFGKNVAHYSETYVASPSSDRPFLVWCTLFSLCEKRC